MKGAPIMVAMGLGLTVTACAQFTPDGGITAISEASRAQVGADVTKITSETDAKQVDAQVADWLRAPLTQESAVRIALLNNRALQVAFNDLGLAEIASVEAGLPPNPRLSLSRIAGANFVEWEARLLADLLALVTLPARREIADQRFARARLEATETTFRTALAARRAWVNAVSARHVVGYLEQARAAMDASADLMRRLGETGAATRLDQARTSAAYAEVSAQLASARLRARREQEALARALGLWRDADRFTTPTQLPSLPRTLDPLSNIEMDAVRTRMDLAIARQDLKIAASQLDLTEASRFVDMLELAGIGKEERDAEGRTRRRGFELEIEIPIFDGGEVKSRRGVETYMRALNQLAARAVEARSEARAAYQAWRASHEIARLYQGRVLPMRKIVADETLLRYNGMLVDVFELLTEARERIAANIAAIEARRDFLLAEIDLRAAVIGGGGASAPDANMPRAALPAGGGH